MTRRRYRISARAAEWLEWAAHALMQGTLDLWQLPPAVLAIYSTGYAHAQQTAQRELAQLDADRAHLYELAHTDDEQQRAHLRMLRVDRALAQAQRAGTLVPGAALVALMVTAFTPPPAPGNSAEQLAQFGAQLAAGSLTPAELPADILDATARVLDAARAQATTKDKQ